ncbi:hypothetical protein ACFU99_36805 [Streptomyces sp. NPDC057654]
MSPQEQAAQEAAEAAQRAEEARRQSEEELRRHGQAVSGMGVRR